MVNGQGSGTNLRATVKGRSRARTAALLSASITAIAISLAGPALATSTTYNGNGTSSDWSDAANWSAGVPGSHYDINLVQTGSHAPTNFDISNTFSSLTLETPTDATTLANGYTVGGSGTFTAIDNFVLVDSAQNASADHLNMNFVLQGATNVTLVSNAGGLVFGGTISGGGGFIFINESGPAIVLSGNNTYSGGTTVSEGALSISSDSNLGTGGTLVLKNGTTLYTTATGTFAHAVTVAGDPTFNVASGTTTTWSGLITDGGSAGDVELDGGGTLALTNTSNSYSGGTVVKGGSTLLIDNDSEIGNTSGGLTLGDATTSGTLQYGSAFSLSSTRAMTLGAGGGTIDTNGFAPTIASGIGGSGALSVIGGGTLTLTNTSNSYSGGTVVKGGSTLLIDDDGELGATTGGLTLGDATTSGTLQYGSGFIISGTRAITLGAGGGTIDINGSTTLISQGITGDGGLTVVNSAGPSEFLTLTGTNTYLGGTTIGAGVKLNIGNHGTTGSIIGDVLDNGTLNFDRTDTGVVFAGAISGSGTVNIVESSGGVVFTGTNTYSGTTTIGGSLTLGDGTTAGTITSDVSTLIGSSKLIFDEPTDVTFAGRIAGSGQVVIEGPGAITLTNTSNLYAGGTVVKGGSTLVIDDDGELGDTSGGLTLGDATTSGTLKLGAAVIVSSSRAVTLGAGGGTIDLNDSDIRILQGITGAGGLTLTNSGGGTGGAILTGTNTYGGGTTIGSHVLLEIGDNGTTGSITGNVLDNGQLSFNRSDTGVVFAGNISGSGQVSILHGGMVFTGTNTYSGNTNINTSLTLGDGTTAGTITGNVVLGVGSSTLTFDEPTDVTYAGNIVNVGRVIIDGPGIITLTGTSNYTGGTTVASGGLSISSDANIGGTLHPLELDDGTTLYTTATGTFTHDLTVAGDPTFSVASGTTTTWSGQITDGASAGDVEVDGGGTLALTNTSNSYSGGTVVKGGSTLLIDNDGELGATTGGLTLGDATTSGTLLLGDDFDLASTRVITLGAGGGTIDTDIYDTVVTQGIGGSGGLTKAGTGTLNLLGTNTYTGGTTIDDGTLLLGDPGDTASIIGAVVNNGEFVLFNADTSAMTSITNNGLTEFVNTQSAGALTISNNDLLVFGEDSTAGNAVITSGQNTLIQFANSASAGNASITTDGVEISPFDLGAGLFFGDTSTAANATIVNNNDGATFFGDNSTAGSANITNNDNGVLDPNSFASGGTYFENDSSAESLTILNNAGGLTYFADASTAANATITNNGGMTYFSGNSTGGEAQLITDANGVVDFSASTGPNNDHQLTAGSISGAGNFYLGANQVTVGGNNLSTTVSGVISDCGAGGTACEGPAESVASTGGMLVKAGTGVLTLAGANTYTGVTTISGGTLALGGAGSILTSAGVVDNGIFDMSASASGLAAFKTLSGSGVVLIDAVPGANSLTLTNASDTFAGVITGNGIFAVAEGTETLTGTNTYTGVTVIHSFYPGISGPATLALNGTGSIATSAGVLDNGVLDISGTNSGASIRTLYGVGTVALGARNLTITDAAYLLSVEANNFLGVISGTGGLTVAGGTEVLTGINAYTGGTTINSGATLQLGTGGTSGSFAGGSIVGDVVDNGTLAFNRSDTVTFGGAISGSGALQQNGSGNLTLSGTSTLTGATTVNAGTLSVNGSIASSTVTVNSGGKLGGTGTVGATTVASGGTLAPGNSIGTLHVSGNLALASGSTYIAEISPSASDEVIVTGTTSLSGQLLASFATGSYTPGTLYTLINSTGLLSGTFTSFDTLGIPSGYNATLSYDSHDVFLTLNPNAFVWSATPGTSDWNTGSNWKFGTVPGSGNVAEFDTTSGPTVTISAADSVKSLWFHTAAPAYAINITGSASGAASLTLTNGGIVNDSSNSPTIAVSGVAGNTGTLTFASTGNAANAKIVAGNYGTVLFQGTSDAGSSAALTTQSGGTVDFSGTTGAAGDKQISAGSIAGAGTYSLGGNALTVGALNTSTEVGGVIADGGSAGGTGASLTKVGTGTLILSGTNSYTGGTVVSEGTLQIGDGSASGSIAGNIVDKATLSFDRSDTYTYGGVISGTGAVKQIGSGTTVLSGVSTYNGPTTISAGVLDVNGSIARSAVTLNGGQLKGSGTVGSVTAGSGSSVAPGNSIGTLNVAGNVTFAAGSTYQVELNSTGASDLISATGTAVLQGGTVQALPAAGSYLPISTYRIVNATGGVSGTFASVASSESTLTPSLLYSANAVDLRMIRNDLQFGGYGYTPNEMAAGAGVSAGGVGSALYVTMATVALTPSAVPPALDALSGEIHASIRSTLIEDDRVVRQSILDHLSGSSGDGIVVWGDGFVSSGGVDGDGNAATMNHNNAGVIAGVDMALSHGLRAGLAGAYAEHKISIADRASTARGQSGHIAGYARWAQDAWSVSGGVDYGWGNSNIARQVKFTGLSESDASKQGHDTTQVFAEVGYTITAGDARFEPYADLAWIQASSGAFAETGGALSDLTGSGRSDAVAYAKAGVRVMPGQFALGDVVFTPSAAVGWQHAIDDFQPGQTVSYAATLKSFMVLGVPLDSDAAVTQAGIDVNLGGQGKLSILYDGVFSSKVRDHTLRAQFGWTF